MILTTYISNTRQWSKEHYEAWQGCHRQFMLPKLWICICHTGDKCFKLNKLKEVNLFVTSNNSVSKAHNYRSQKQLLLNHSYMFRPSLPSSGIKLYSWRWSRGPATCRRASIINISMISKCILGYTVKMYYKIVYHVYK